MTKTEMYQVLMAQSKIYEKSSPRLCEAFEYAAELIENEIQRESLEGLGETLKDAVKEYKN